MTAVCGIIREGLGLRKNALLIVVFSLLRPSVSTTLNNINLINSPSTNPMSEMTQPPITLKLKSRDGEIFEVEKPVAMKINFVKSMLEDVDEKDAHEIPMGDVEASILAKVVEFCKFRHQQELNQTSADEVDRWEKAFVQVDKSTLFQLILAANFLDVQALLDLTCKTIADMIKGKTPEQIRAEFDIENDFTPEQLEEVRRDNAWCAEER